MKNILITLILLTSTTVSYALGGMSNCSAYTYGQGSKGELSNFLQTLKQFVRQYECNNTPAPDDETEAMAICTKCSLSEPVHFFSQIKNWITEQQNDILEPCKNIDSQLLRKNFSKMMQFPLRVVLPGGRLRIIHSAEEFYDHLPSIFNNHILHTIRNRNFEDMICSATGAHMEDTIFIRKDEDQQLKIFLIQTPH